MPDLNTRRVWRPGKLQKRVEKVARQLAEHEASRIPWSLLLEARELYIRCQAFAYWIRAIEDSEGCFPEWLAGIVNKRCPGFLQFRAEQRTDSLKTLPLFWYRLDQWINERIFARPRREGWMNAVGYYAVRDLAALRDEAHWYYCDRQWKVSKPAVYPSFQECRRASEHCSDKALDNFETTDELRELVKLSRQVRPRTHGLSRGCSLADRPSRLRSPSRSLPKVPEAP